MEISKNKSGLNAVPPFVLLIKILRPYFVRNEWHYVYLLRLRSEFFLKFAQAARHLVPSVT
jgi:hypothetical protein